MTLLALAKKVYEPNVLVTSDQFGCVYIGHGDETELFDPRENPEQLLDVLCWLLETDHAGKQIAVTTMNVRCLTYDEDGEDVLCWNEWHKNTPQSLAAAIVKAACRVAGEEA